MDAVPQYVAPAARERAMRGALAGLIIFLAVSDGLDWQLSLGYGLSVKNAILYLLALALAMKFAVQQNFALQLRSILACFVILTSCAIFSLLVAEFAIDYPRYDAIRSAMAVKNQIIDHMLFFLVFFYGLRESRSAHGLSRFLLLAVVFANCVALLDALGVVQLGELEQRKDGRVEGVIGESNQYGAYVCLFLPGLCAAAVMSHGIRRIMWFSGLLLSTIALILTVSRGAYVGVVVAAVWTAMLLRRHISPGRVVAWGSASVGIVVVLLAIVTVRYGQLLGERLERSMVNDVETISSGRTAVWWNAISRMAETPLTLITGFGWEVYDSMPFKHSPHNYYLGLWFNLGLVGLACGVMLFVLLIREARAGVACFDANGDANARPALFAFVMGSLSYAIATFFVDLYSPWTWFWAYAGLAMRIAVNARAHAPQSNVETIAVTQASAKRDPFGWIATARP